MKSPVRAEQPRHAQRGLQINHSSISARSHKVSKTSDIVEIPFKRHTVASHYPSPPISPSSDITTLARKLKERLAAAMTKITPLHAAPALEATQTPRSLDNEDDLRKQPATLSSADWTSKKSALHNLELLKKYLTFVSHEGTLVDINQTSDCSSIRLSISRSPDTDYPVARLGASLIESMVHNAEETDRHQVAMHTKPQVCRTTPYSVSGATTVDRRRARRPTRLLHEDSEKTMIQQKGHSRHVHKNKKKKKKQTKNIEDHGSDSESNSSSCSGGSGNNKSSSNGNAIHCICETPHEEFGSMVQCDDCSCWLHLDCLKLSDHTLQETFRCPSCFMSLGANHDAKLLSSLTWRLAAQLKSRRLAALKADVSSDEEDNLDEEDNKGPDLVFGSDLESGRAADAFSSLPDWTDTMSEPSSCSAQSSSGTSSPCEARTPDQFCYEPFDFCYDATVTLDSESLEFISRLAYLQTVDSVKKELFAPNASDVFLCENLTKGPAVTPASPTVHFAPELPPSSICSQALSEFAFDNCPFWDPLP